MIIDGRTIAKKMLARAKTRAAALDRVPRILAIVANETPVTKSYLSIKQKRAADSGCILDELHFDAWTTITEQLRTAVLSADADAIIVQLPLEKRIDSRIVCDAIPLEKDADVLSTVARMKFETDEYDALVPPVAGALAEILSVHSIDPTGKKAVVIGMGLLVGRSCAIWLSHKQADVTHLSFRSGNFSALKDADIIVSGAGSPHFIKPNMLKDGVVLIDAGTSELGGTLTGDADPACVDKCSVFTPVPGGVGPLAVACLFENAVTLAERAINK